MERGSSIPWQETLREATGEFRLDGSALREYFRPLEDWLRTENLRTGEVVGWSYGKRERARGEERERHAFKFTRFKSFSFSIIATLPMLIYGVVLN